MSTYLIKSEYLKLEQIKPILIKRGLSKYDVKSFPNQPTLMLVDGKYCYDKSLYKYNPDVKNMMGDGKKTIVQKNNLYTNLKKYNRGKNVRKYLLEQKNFRIDKSFDTKKYKYLFNPTNIDDNKIGDNKIGNNKIGDKKINENKNVWILKLVEGFSGKGIHILEKYSDFEKLINVSKSKLSIGKEYVLQKYIVNPFLYKGKKFHLRVYFIVSSVLDHAYIYDKMFVVTAKKKYKKDNYENKDIHDTHFDSTEREILFHKSFPNNIQIKVMKQITNIFKDVLKIIKKDCYSNKDCFEIFGADIMILDNLDVKLIEINSKIGYKLFKFSNNKYYHELIENVLDNIVSKILPIKKFNSNNLITIS